MVPMLFVWLSTHRQFLSDRTGTLDLAGLEGEHRLVALLQSRQYIAYSGPGKCRVEQAYVERCQTPAVGVEGLVVELNELFCGTMASQKT